MAYSCTAQKFLQKSFYLTVLLCCLTNVASGNRELGEENWKDILEGEWMVEFYAPWCPACNALAPAWRELSSQAARKSLKLKTGAIDVTQSPGLSGRFVVTALPTIFHVKNGEFRQYKGPRDAASMVSFVEERRWQQVEPVPSWKAPDSIQMTLVAEFFKLSQALRSVHNTLMETYGLPTWGSYLIFAIVTIFVGALLGLILVCVIDLLYPPKTMDKVLVSKAEADQLTKGDISQADEKIQELLNEDIVDDADTADSDAEKNSPSDTSEDEKQKVAESGDNVEKEKTGELRKRRPRKAD